ncbi:MAG: hypothetical protein F4W95_00505 [Chloroflexi bacterium]|nr:hypothetical protein [Chloroflexota bacterium]MYD46948.1 hypothetical protein [Chloroflexota bacterium]
MILVGSQTWLSLRQRASKAVRFVKGISLPTWRDILLRLALVVPCVVLPIAVLILIRAEPIGALAIDTGSIAFLGALLGAQSAVAALTLAVMLFVMQAVSARRDVDDRVYAEYVRRSWVKPIFWCSIGAVAFTGSVLTVERTVADAGATLHGVPGISNLAILAVVAFTLSLVAPVELFRRALKLTEPEHWQTLRLDVNKREVREAVTAFLGRLQRAVDAHENNEADLSILFPDAGERSADQAVRALLDDARRAMDERRHGELVRSLHSIETLVAYAMDEIEEAGVRWETLGRDAQWPPLWELNSALDSYREEVIRAGNRDYLQQLWGLDYWFVSTGLRRSCRGLAVFGLSGYRKNYQISTRLGNHDFHEAIRDRFLMNLDGFTFEHRPEALTTFMEDVIRHQGNVLYDALRLGATNEYLWLHREFDSILSTTLERWDRDRDVWSLSTESELSAYLRQQYRIAIMGLAGKAVISSRSGDLADPTPYLDAARAMYDGSEGLDGDVSVAMEVERPISFHQWWDWDTPYHLSARSGSLLLERYPLTCFAVLLMERAEDPTLNLNLHGRSQSVLRWFSDNAEDLEPFVRDTLGVSPQERRDSATEILQRAVRADEIQEDLKIISREISDKRIQDCEESVLRGMQMASSVYKMFEQAGASVRLVEGVIDLPEFGRQQWQGKGFFVDPADGDMMGYATVDGQDWGRSIPKGVIGLLCEELDNSMAMTADLDSVGALCSAVDMAIDDLGTDRDVVIIVAGEWDYIMLLDASTTAGYESFWQLTDADSMVDVGRYRGYPILRGPADGERRLYVIDLSTWGTMVRVPFEGGEDLLFDVKPVTAEWAQELLASNPDVYPEKPDDESKIRKLQTFVDMKAVIRVGFRNTDPTRARRIVSIPPQSSG